jgi:hypothetical protein
VAIFKHYLEHGVGQCFLYYSLDAYGFFFGHLQAP